MGAAGKSNQSIVDKILAGSFPHEILKTIGRETFGDSCSEDLCKRMWAKDASPEDYIATITRITAQALAEAYKRWGPQGGIDEIFLGGGGSYNPNIINYLCSALPKTRIAFLDEIGVPCGSREAMDFGSKDLECVVGRGPIVPERVESNRAGIIGQIQPGAGMQYHKLLKYEQDFWGDWPIEERMKPVLRMGIVEQGGNANGTNGVNGVH